MKEKSIKLLISDIDGTIIQDREPFPDKLVHAVKKLQNAGIKFTFASGRLPCNIDPYLEKICISMPVVACNGALVYNGKRILEEKTFAVGLLKDLINIADKKEMTVLYAISGKEYCNKDTIDTIQKRKQRGFYHPIRELTEKDMNELQVNKVNIFAGSKGENIDIFEEEIEKLKGNLLFTRYGQEGLEIVTSGVNKATGVKMISEFLNIKPQEIAAIGDNENDIEMLELVGVGAAVENSVKELKDIASYNCSKSGADGVIEFIEYLIDKKEKDNETFNIN